MVSLLVFGMVRLTGNPVLELLPDSASPADVARLHAHLGLDRPLPEQYVIYVRQVLTGDFGTSLALHEPVKDAVSQRIGPTLRLSLAAIVLMLVVGIPAGIYAAYWQGGWFDRSARWLAALGQSAPQFWVGLLLVMLFAVRWKVLPAGGYGGITHLILPAFTVAVVSMAGILRLVRSSMLEVLTAEYVKFLRAKGVSERRILWKHALRNASLPVLTFAGVLIAGLLTGSVVAETVFVWPGLGQLTYQSIQSRDFPVIQAAVLFFSAIYIAVNFAVDIAYVLLNPRLRAVSVERG
jgi:peptide/nickel transport system permease protein